LALAAKDAVPLAARDLVAWMGSDHDADRAAIMRRIVKLAEHGWVMIERTPSAKHRLLPTWGRDHTGTVRPWRFYEADSGRPHHLRGRRVPLALLDDYLGRLDPQPGHRSGTAHAHAALAEIQQHVEALQAPLRFAPIRLAVAAADAPAHGMTLADFAPTSVIAQEYRHAAEQILAFLEERP
jgi:hypothetical protein